MERYKFTSIDGNFMRSSITIPGTERAMDYYTRFQHGKEYVYGLKVLQEKDDGTTEEVVFIKGRIVPVRY